MTTTPRTALHDLAARYARTIGAGPVDYAVPNVTGEYDDTFTSYHLRDFTLLRGTQRIVPEWMAREDDWLTGYHLTTTPEQDATAQLLIQRTPSLARRYAQSDGTDSPAAWLTAFHGRLRQHVNEQWRELEMGFGDYGEGNETKPDGVTLDLRSAPGDETLPDLTFDVTSTPTGADLTVTLRGTQAVIPDPHALLGALERHENYAGGEVTLRGMTLTAGSSRTDLSGAVRAWLIVTLEKEISTWTQRREQRAAELQRLDQAAARGQAGAGLTITLKSGQVARLVPVTSERHLLVMSGEARAEALIYTGWERVTVLNGDLDEQDVLTSLTAEWDTLSDTLEANLNAELTAQAEQIHGAREAALTAQPEPLDVAGLRVLTGPPVACRSSGTLKWGPADTWMIIPALGLRLFLSSSRLHDFAKAAQGKDASPYRYRTRGPHHAQDVTWADDHAPMTFGDDRGLLIGAAALTRDGTLLVRPEGEEAFRAVPFTPGDLAALGQLPEQLAARPAATRAQFAALGNVPAYGGGAAEDLKGLYTDAGRLGAWTDRQDEAGTYATIPDKGKLRQTLSAPLTRALYGALRAGTAWSGGGVTYDPAQNTLRLWWRTLTLTPRVRAGVTELLVQALHSPAGH
ncbi:hypothetical protein [Deinococcus soli (ex Cha et al. 2016)]|uniref:Antitoxin (DNA-binding transcriptional repressor) of toxin-antitoxin stability system n=2 Tax=Deinococcus soli (ex Cha et al. 2016) TaxID=1309411 RepID=A0AAE3XDB1_9DEIO|nr:hypothetical protein [Deinococcus soli (ex Cha et al. 2016)]MDR6218559.1 antitoxin (DNA-binding transcriptional repressor) of toxin-antitoxin stability system [Deinococcus soli (ex Cha et al. 2016)]MDR6329299.1 antitoxin (DNA-binding transcriptional repressor) of toxin-antitoxin stability system [Deinococcus soli (ex Cha et al. 2016)]MDR6751572.1 antitoxin (DNA-binding transcriptional repressor) of toxin-antitoxin stability system [Deinococcus soli (ex Cha et al. 2016)]